MSQADIDTGILASRQYCLGQLAIDLRNKTGRDAG